MFTASLQERFVLPVLRMSLGLSINELSLLLGRFLKLGRFFTLLLGRYRKKIINLGILTVQTKTKKSRFIAGIFRSNLISREKSCFYKTTHDRGCVLFFSTKV